jgi:hypothetical protein
MGKTPLPAGPRRERRSSPPTELSGGPRVRATAVTTMEAMAPRPGPLKVAALSD